MNLGRLLINCKDRVSKDRKSGVYRLNCKDCDACYIGQTGRNFRERIAEHRRAVGKADCNSMFASHLFENAHRCDFSDFQVLYNCNKGMLLDRLELVEIRKALRNRENLTNEILFQTSSPLLDLCS